MSEPVKSILLVDLDGLGQGLVASGGKRMDERLAERIGDWSSAIESGELIEPAGTLHPIAERRCYVGAASSDAARAAFERAGFEMIDCDGRAQFDLCLAVDAMDAAADAGGGLDFILLSAAADLTPLVERLHARGHRVAAYVGDATTLDYRAAADMVIPASAFAAFLAESKAPQRAASATAAYDRDALETFAREIHMATNIPMFSPKTFAELFRTLASEVAKNGYHFNDTAKSVAEQMGAAGRNVTARQVVFVVKGLALKGHVFSTNDTAERLAAVFREQAHYLIDNAGIALDAKREALLSTWITAPAAPPPPAKAARPSPPAIESKPARLPPPAPAAPPAAEAKPVRKPQPVRRPEKPTASRPASPPRPPERPKSPALPAKAAPPPPPEPPKPANSSADLRATIAARIAASAKMKPSARPPMRPADSPAPRPPEPAAPPPAADDTIESSILAAIAEAVDVLVDDGNSEMAKARSAPPEREAHEQPARRPPPGRQPPAEAPPPPADEETEADGGGDIGDEIQRIVASYNRNRDGDQRG